MKLILEGRHGNTYNVTGVAIVAIAATAAVLCWALLREAPATPSADDGVTATTAAKAGAITQVIGTHIEQPAVEDGPREPSQLQHGQRQTFEQTFDLSKASGRRVLVQNAASCEVVDGLAMTSTGWQQVPFNGVSDSNTCYRYGSRIMWKTRTKQPAGAWIRIRFSLSE